MKYQRINEKSGSPFLPSAKANVLRESLCLPAAVLKKTQLEQNIRWMNSFAAAHQVQLAPHCKTAMMPALMQQLLRSGVWGLTVATAYQAQIAAEHGAKKILLANQLTGRANMAVVARLLASGAEVFVCVDHSSDLARLNQFFATEALQLPVLIELGVPGGRCGCRSHEQALALSRQLQQFPALQLAGIEFYEGVIKGEAAEQQIRLFCQGAAALLQQLQHSGALTRPRALLSGAGSVWYDVVAEEFQQSQLADSTDLLLRPGCYISLDVGIYQQSQQQITERSSVACMQNGALQNALEVACYVQSVPEPGFAVLNLGKRDAAFDAGLPLVLALYRNGQLLAKPDTANQLSKMMDQHAFWHFGELDVQVGDMLLLGTSHPCLTFDKWRQIWLVDNDYNLLEALPTCF
ncbi:amino acid deaminase [Rheinheimera sp.]|uniref:amino acid deaminase n=1 Tax=Rheinheimera sp. TaxID=1869214 RepID=UPI00307FAFDC